MASLLRQIVAGPRARHPEAGLDLCYVTDNSKIIATSGPSSSYPQRYYRNPTESLVKFLDYKHGDKWSIWEFRAEGTGYPDSEVYNRIRHYPWPDHHPPPFALIPNIMASMRDWLKGPDAEKGRVVVVHCKAGKGRSGSIATSYLISEEGWSVEDAMLRFTERRMRSGFGAGISIPSQIRWVGYVDWWAKHGNTYVERKIEIREVHVWGLRSGVKVAIEGFVEEGKVIKTFHTFTRHERTLMDGPVADQTESSLDTPTTSENSTPLQQTKREPMPYESSPTSSSTSINQVEISNDSGAAAALFRPTVPIILPTSDVNVDIERRNKAKYGLTMVTSVAHVWFNAFFESQYSLQRSTAPPEATSSATQPQILDPTNPPSSGVFSIHWDAMDGLRGSSRKGTRAIDRLSVVWSAVAISPSAAATKEGELPKIITQPKPGANISDTGAAERDNSSLLSPLDPPNIKKLGLRSETPKSQDLSRSSSPVSSDNLDHKDHDSEKGVKVHGPDGHDFASQPNDKDTNDETEVAEVVEGKEAASVDDLPVSTQSIPGQIKAISENG
ncbi:uncharacterized protein KY384_008698 [Bacidia gigantensis]|uniref:uncharacterized protein n=1 Tax=Bacidia gigantensis TaxID=2732470 RepID=UPI001D054F8F|nr:uncharacterized protein KY384_008698 [Bacidia gigantensis]KAG8526498.1 hypothetical protein KY384_008698 [Bacidia gigantensis]